MRLNKWQKELIQLGLDNDAKRAKELQTMYRKLLRSLKSSIKSMSVEEPYWKQIQRGYLQTMLDEVAQIIRDSGVAVVGYAKEALTIEFDRGYDELFYLASQEGLELSFNYFPKEVLAQMLYQPLVGENFSTLLWQNTNELSQQVTRLLTVGIMQGTTNAKLAQQLAEIVNSDYYKASRIVRTESLRFHSLGQQESYKEAARLGIQAKKQWASVKDSRTRPSHRHLDGKSVGLEEHFTLDNGGRALGPRLFGIAGEDINCRCWTIATFDDTETATKPKRLSYSQWKKTLN